MSRLTRRVALRPRIQAGPAYDPDAAAYFAAMTVQPTTTRKDLLNTLILSLKAVGVWDTYDLMYIGASHDRQAATLNARSPGEFTLSSVNSPPFVADRFIGVQNGGGYWNTGFNPSAITEANRKLRSGSATFGFWSVLNLVVDSSSMGAYQDASNGGYTLAPKNTTSSATSARVQSLNAVPAASVDTPSSLGLFNARRDGSILSIRRNNVLQIAGSMSHGPIPNQTFRIGNISGASGVPTQAAIAFVGGFKTDAQCDAEYNAFQTYLSAIGAL